MPDRVTMADVAAEAGVSLMTVSRVVNNKADVSQATRRRVRQVIDRLGYRPSGIARSLATKQTGTLGLVVPDVANPFFSDVARGVEHAAYTSNYNVFLCNTEENPQREMDLLQSLEEKRVDGLISCSSRLDEDQLHDAFLRHRCVVLINRELDGSSVGSVLADDQGGARRAVEHLVQRGHRQIGYLAGPPASRSGLSRLVGYRAALMAAGLPYREELAVECDPNVDGGRQAASWLLMEHPELTALLCYNDLVATGALQTCAQLGRRIPDSLALIGFDDIPLAALVTPPLTTCRILRYEMGVQATQLLLDRVAGSNMEWPRIVLPTELIIRDSAP